MFSSSARYFCRTLLSSSLTLSPQAEVFMKHLTKENDDCKLLLLSSSQSRHHQQHSVSTTKTILINEDDDTTRGLISDDEHQDDSDVLVNQKKENNFMESDISNNSNNTENNDNNIYVTVLRALPPPDYFLWWSALSESESKENFTQQEIKSEIDRITFTRRKRVVNGRRFPVLKDMMSSVPASSSATSSSAQILKVEDTLVKSSSSSSSLLSPSDFLSSLNRIVEQNYFPQSQKQFSSTTTEVDKELEQVDAELIRRGVEMILLSSPEGPHQQLSPLLLSIDDFANIFALTALYIGVLLSRDPVLPYQFTTNELSTVISKTTEKLKAEFDDLRQRRHEEEQVQQEKDSTSTKGNCDQNEQVQNETRMIALFASRLKSIEKIALASSFMNRAINRNIDFWSALFLLLKLECRRFSNQHHQQQRMRSTSSVRGESSILSSTLSSSASSASTMTATITLKKMTIKKSCSGIMFSLTKRQQQLQEEEEHQELQRSSKYSNAGEKIQKAHRHAKRMIVETEKILLEHVIHVI